MKKGGTSWPEARCERLRELWADEALSTLDIATLMKLTHAQVTKRANRMGLRRGGNPVLAGMARTAGIDRAALTRMWLAGDRIGDIAAVLNITRSAVQYQVRAMALPLRPVGWRWTGQAVANWRATRRVANRSNLVDGADDGVFAGDSVSSFVVARESGTPDSEASETPAPFLPLGGAGIPDVAAISLGVSRAPVASGRTCAWVEGERPRWRYCDDPAVPGKSYCAKHCAVAYQFRAPKAA